MKRKTLVIIWIMWTTLLLAGCWWKKDTTTTNKDKQSITTNKVKQQVKDSIDSRLRRQAIAIWINRSKLNINKFKKAYNVWVACQRRFCKNEYDNIKKDRITLDYFNKIVSRLHIPTNAIQYSSPIDVMKQTIKNGYKTLSACVMYYKKGWYKNSTDCIKANYTNFRNLKANQRKNIIDFLSKWAKYNIGFENYLNVKRTCKWWKEKRFEIGNKLQANLNKIKAQWFNATNFFKSTYEDYLKNKMSPQQYFTMMKNLCWYKKFIKQQKNSSK